MKTYPLIEKLGLNQFGYQTTYMMGPVMGEKSKYESDVVHVIRCDDLEALLEKAQKVYGSFHRASNNRFVVDSTDDNLHESTHVGLVIGIEPIKRGVKKSEIQDIIAKGIPLESTGGCILSHKDRVADVMKLLMRIEKEGVIDD